MNVPWIGIDMASEPSVTGWIDCTSFDDAEAVACGDADELADFLRRREVVRGEQV